VDYLLIGVVAKAHGLRGDLTVVAHNPDSPLWKVGMRVALVPLTPSQSARDRVSLDAPRLAYVTRVRKNPDGKLTLALDVCVDRDQADALRGVHLGVDPALLPPLDETEVYHHELPGWAVVDMSGALLGTVLGVFAGPGGDLIEVQPPDPKADTFFVPFVAQIVTTIDRPSRRLVIDPPEGLLELAASPT